MKRLIPITLLTLLGVLLSACASPNGAPAPAKVETIDAAAAYARMQSGDPIVILDVRTAAEYAESHIPGALLLPNEEIGTEPPALLPDKDAEILIYCRSGNRSAQAAKKLANMGYAKLRDFGGINSWPYETEAGAWQNDAKANP